MTEGGVGVFEVNGRRLMNNLRRMNNAIDERLRPLDTEAVKAADVLVGFLRSIDLMTERSMKEMPFGDPPKDFQAKGGVLRLLAEYKRPGLVFQPGDPKHRGCLVYCQAFQDGDGGPYRDYSDIFFISQTGRVWGLDIVECQWEVWRGRIITGNEILNKMRRIGPDEQKDVFQTSPCLGLRNDLYVYFPGSSERARGRDTREQLRRLDLALDPTPA